MSSSLKRSVPKPEASLGQALLLVVRDDLPDEVVEDFRATGTPHLLAISGLHVSALMGILLATSTRLLGRKRQVHLIAQLVAISMSVAGSAPTLPPTAFTFSRSLSLVPPRHSRPFPYCHSRSCFMDC